jgi:hypothetical protein
MSQPDFLNLWIPGQAADLDGAISAKTIHEDHFHDAKRELGANRRANQDLAIDIASLAVDGGLLFVGIEERDHAFSSSPVDLPGLRERVEQIAGSLIDPALRIEVRALPVAEDPARGYLVVIVPPSPEAPHAVDGVYRGRGDSTNRRLTDIEIRRIRTERERDLVSIEALLDAEIARDPIKSDPKSAHMFGVANPIPGRRGIGVALLGDAAQEKVVKLVRSTPPIMDNSKHGWGLDFDRLGQARPRADGWGVSTFRIGPGRVVAPDQDEEGILDIEIGESGMLRLFCGGASRSIGRGWVQPGQVTPQQAAPRYIFERLIGGLTWRLVELAGRLSREARYLGNWQFGIAVTGLRGLRSFEMAIYHDAEFAEPYSADTYRESAIATAIEASDDPDAIAHRLVDRLNRSVFGDADRVFPRFDRG